MGRYKIRYEELLFAVSLVEPLVFLLKPLIHAVSRLSHVFQHVIHAMLRGDLELAGDVVFNELGKKLTVFIGQQVIKPDTGADKRPF